MAMPLPEENVRMITGNPATPSIQEDYTPIGIPSLTVSATDHTVPGQEGSTFSGEYDDDAGLNTPESSQHGRAVAPHDGSNRSSLGDEENNSSMHLGDTLMIERFYSHPSFTESLAIAQPSISIVNLPSLIDDNNNSSAVIPSRSCTTDAVHHTLTSHRNTTTTHPHAVRPLEAVEGELQGPFFPYASLEGQDCSNFLPPLNSTSPQSLSSYLLPSASSTAPAEIMLGIPRSGDAGGIDSVNSAGSSLPRGPLGVAAVPTGARTSKPTCDVYSQTDESSMREESSKLSSEHKGGKWTFMFFWVLLLNHSGGDTLVRWISQKQLVFQVVERCTKRVSEIWGRLDTSPYHPSWDNLTERIRYSLKKKEGYFIDFYKSSEFQQMPRKRCFRFSQHIDQMIQMGKVGETQFRRMQVDTEKYFLQAPTA